MRTLEGTRLAFRNVSSRQSWTTGRRPELKLPNIETLRASSRELQQLSLVNMRSGDWGNLFILANSGLFLASVILQNAGVVDWHSAARPRRGRRPEPRVAGSRRPPRRGAPRAEASRPAPRVEASRPVRAGASPLLQAERSRGRSRGRIDNNLQANERAERNERAEDRKDMRRYTVSLNPRHAPSRKSTAQKFKSEFS